MTSPTVSPNTSAILDRINAGILLIDKSYRIQFANDWIKACTHLDIAEDTNLLDIFAFSPRELSRLNRKIMTALKLGSPSFSSAEHDGYLLPIANRKLLNPQFQQMQQEVAIMPLTGHADLILIIVYDQTALMISKHEVLLQSQGLAQALAELKTAHKKLAAQTELIERQANFDELTGLPNWTLFKDRLRGAITLAAEKKLKVGILYFDLDGFKPLNDRYGHPFGDQVLQLVAEILREELSAKDTVARLSGDEFALIICQLESAESLISLANRILRRVAEPRTIRKEEIYLSASIGISLYPDDGTEHETLLKRADLAMESAKARGRGGFRYFTDNLDLALRRKIALQTELLRAMANQQFFVVFQPKYQARREQLPKLVGAEALIRSTHPELAAMGPAEYIPLAEKMGLISQITEFVLHATCRVLNDLVPVNKAVPISINLSALDLSDPEFGTRLVDLAQTHGIDHHWLQLELTEHSAISSPEADIQKLRQFRKLGFTIALDDFGTGYSSLSQLAALPLDVLKIDKSFVDNAHDNPQQQTLLRTIIQLARALGLDPLTEGVEDSASIELLQDYGCDLFQGYFFSRPLAASEFIELCLASP